MTGTIDARLTELGLELPDAPAPAANYVPHVRIGDLVFISGQISQDKGGLIKGRLGDDMDVAAGAAAARRCGLSILAQVRAACGGDLDRVVRAVKLTGFVNSTTDFVDQPKVINGCSDLLVEVLGDAGRHSRSAVSAPSLPLGVAVEIEAIFQGEMIVRPVALPDSFLRLPIAHRAWHDRAVRRPENSRAAIRAAMAAGYAIEIDIQPSGDGVPMVFHDYDLRRLTGQPGRIRGLAAAELGALSLLGGDEGIPTLAEALAIVGGRVPLLIEIKDQDGAMGPNVGELERAVAADLKEYRGDVALMSFNPHSVAALAELASDRPRGLTTSAYRAEDWPLLPAAIRDRLRAIPDLDRVGASFVSHEASDLGRPLIADLRARGIHI